MRKHHGEIRQSQLITTFGPGAMVDLPDALRGRGRPRLLVPASEMPAIVEERLSLKVAAALDLVEARAA